MVRPEPLECFGIAILPLRTDPSTTKTMAPRGECTHTPSLLANAGEKGVFLLAGETGTGVALPIGGGEGHCGLIPLLGPRPGG